MRRTLFLLGPSNLEGQSTTDIESHSGGVITGTASWSGVLPIQSFIEGDASLSSKSDIVLVGVQRLQVRGGENLHLFNMVGDADASSDTLQKIQSMTNAIKPRRIFNAPASVRKTSRVALAETLKGIASCRLPRVASVDPKNFEELSSELSAFNSWPLIVRARGYHAGSNMLFVENEEQLRVLEAEGWLYQGTNLIEFVDSRDSRGLFTKYRVIMIDGEPYARHSITSDKRFIHARNRADLMHVDQSLCEQEKLTLDEICTRSIGKINGLSGVDFLTDTAD